MKEIQNARPEKRKSDIKNEKLMGKKKLNYVPYDYWEEAECPEVGWFALQPCNQVKVH